TLLDGHFGVGDVQARRMGRSGRKQQRERQEWEQKPGCHPQEGHGGIPCPAHHTPEVTPSGDSDRGYLRQMRSRRKRARLVLMVAVAFATAGLGVTAYLTDAFRWLELRSIDARFSIRGERPKPPEVAVVAVDDTTFNELPIRWPFPRRYHARVIDNLKRA